jgi:hypothetical protein
MVRDKYTTLAAMLKKVGIKNKIILSCVLVTAKEVWAGNWIYWTLTARNYK